MDLNWNLNNKNDEAQRVVHEQDNEARNGTPFKRKTKERTWLTVTDKIWVTWIISGNLLLWDCLWKNFGNFLNFKFSIDYIFFKNLTFWKNSWQRQVKYRMAFKLFFSGNFIFNFIYRIMKKICIMENLNNEENLLKSIWYYLKKQWEKRILFS